MVTKEIQTKKTKHLKERRRKKKNTTNQNAFLRRNYDTKKKKQRNKLFYIQQQKRKEFSEWKRLNWLNYSSRKTLGEAVCFFKLNSWIILPAFLNGISTRENEVFRSENKNIISILQEFWSNFYVGKASGFSFTYF